MSFLSQRYRQKSSLDFFSSINLPRAGLLFCLFVLNPIKQAQQPVARRSFTELHTIRRNIFFLLPLSQPSARFSSYPLVFPYLGVYSDQSLLIYHFYGIPAVSIDTSNYLQVEACYLSQLFLRQKLFHITFLLPISEPFPCILYPLQDGMHQKCIQALKNYRVA